MHAEIEEFQALLDQCTRVLFESPEEGLRLARDSLDQAEKLGNLLRSRALATVATAHKENSRYTEADEYFQEAITVLGHDLDFDLYAGDIHRRLVYLKLDERHLDEAISSAERAIELYTSGHASQHDLGKAILSKAIVLLELEAYRESIPIFEESLTLIDPERCPVSHHVALHNLSHAIIHTRGYGADDLREALRVLDTVRKKIPRGASMARLKIKWVEAAALLKCGINNRALKLLKEIRRELIKLNASPVEIAAACLDMAQIHLLDGALDHCVSALSAVQDNLSSSRRPPRNGG